MASLSASSSPAPSDATVAIIGFGAMGEAIAAGAIRAGVVAAGQIAAVDPSPERQASAERLGCRVSELAPAAEARRILLAVKPQSFPAVAAVLRGAGIGSRPTTVLSVMAGISGDRIAAALGGSVAVIRSMPNTPARIGEGMTVLAPSIGAGPDDVAFAERLLGAVGRVAILAEPLLDAVTAVSGSGPAYVFLLAEAWEDAAVGLGIDRATARLLVRQTIRGASRMLDEPSADAAALRAAVTSKGGTTAAAIEVLETRDLRGALAEALAAAARRGGELARDAAEKR
jgi:pyrroline-5-carboxylate reductase